MKLSLKREMSKRLHLTTEADIPKETKLPLNVKVYLIPCPSVLLPCSVTKKKSFKHVAVVHKGTLMNRKF